MKSKINKYRFSLLLSGLVLMAFSCDFKSGKADSGKSILEDKEVHLEQKPTAKAIPTHPVYVVLQKDTTNAEKAKQKLEPEPLPEPIIKTEVINCYPPEPDTTEFKEIVMNCYDPNNDFEVEIELVEPDTSFVIIAEEPATFEGGMQAFFKYLAKNIQFPKEAKRMGIMDSKIFVQFIVNRDGSLSDIEVIRGENPAYNAEVIRVVQNSPKWIPAKQKDKIVRQKITLPISIHLK